MANRQVIFTLDGKDIIIQCLKNDNMKDICQKFSTKVKKNIKSLVFLYSGNKVNFEKNFNEQANSIDKKNKEMRILVYNNEDDDFKCPKCGEKIKIKTEKLDEIIISNEKIKNSIDGIKFQLESVIKISNENMIIFQLNNIISLLNKLDEDFKKINNKMKILIEDNNFNDLNNISDIKTKDINKKFIARMSIKDELMKIQPQNKKNDQKININNSKLNIIKTLNFIGSRDSKGLKQGFGIQKENNGDSFRGIFKNDKVSGWAIFKNNEGDIFKGEYLEDKIYGYGEYSHKNGDIYYGYWKEDNIFGIGYEILEDSSGYSGEYKTGKKNGIGTYKWKDGSIYMGEWKNNDMEGYGIYKFKDGRQYLGEWENNKMNGYGEFIWPEGKIYIGFYKNNKREGFGIYYFPDNRIFVGFWKEGKQNGVGKLIQDGKDEYGIWQNGKIEKWLEKEYEFVNFMKSEEKKYCFVFLYDVIKLKNLISSIQDNEEDSDKENGFLFEENNSEENEYQSNIFSNYKMFKKIK